MVFVGRRRQRSQPLVAALAVRADGAGPRLQVGRIDVFFRARILVHLLAGSAEQPGALIVNWLGIELRIDHREVEVQVAPKNEGSGSSLCLRPSVGIRR